METLNEEFQDNLPQEEVSPEDSGSKEVEGFIIESDKEVPPVKQKRTRVWDKLASSMHVGDSVLFDKKDANAFTSYLHKNEIPYTSRAEGEGKVRVWKLRKTKS